MALCKYFYYYFYHYYILYFSCCQLSADNSIAVQTNFLFGLECLCHVNHAAGLLWVLSWSCYVCCLIAVAVCCLYQIKWWWWWWQIIVWVKELSLVILTHCHMALMFVDSGSADCCYICLGRSMELAYGSWNTKGTSSALVSFSYLHTYYCYTRLMASFLGQPW